MLLYLLADLAKQIITKKKYRPNTNGGSIDSSSLQYVTIILNLKAKNRRWAS